MYGCVALVAALGVRATSGRRGPGVPQAGEVAVSAPTDGARTDGAAEKPPRGTPRGEAVA